ncbi:MAG: DUF177 domain-containing protein [Elusimicrobia bacterium]|nr:DUF177 domain-containing protein [Elusimicrobiota bacterium]
MTSRLKIQTGKVKEKGRLRLEERVPASEFPDCLGEADRLSAPLDVALDLFVQDEHIGIKGVVKGEWELECCRCLAQARSAFSAKVESALLTSGSAIDAAEEVRQALVLALPARVVCRPDCKGLCPSCRRDRNKGDCGCKAASV